MALPISLYDPMVLIEAAATMLTGCYIVKLALLERAEIASSRIRARAASPLRQSPRTVRNQIPASRIIAPMSAPQSSLPVLSPIPMNGAPRVSSSSKSILRPVEFTASRAVVSKPAQPQIDEKVEQKIVPIRSSKRGSKTVSAAHAFGKLQQTDWLQRA